MATETTSQNICNVVPSAKMEQQAIQTSPSSPIDPSTATGTTLQQEPIESSPSRGGDEPEVHAEQIKKPAEVKKDDPNVNVMETPPPSPTFKEQVYGYAKLIRGTVFGQPEVKEQGTQVLRGEQGIPLRRGSQCSK